MFYAQTKDRTFIAGPFDTYKQAATCARINSRKLGTTVQIVRADEDAVAAYTRSMEAKYDAIVAEAVNEQLVFGDTPEANPLVELYDALDRHDWFYSYSDDHRVWKRGEAERDRLNNLADSIPGGAELMDAYYTYMFSGEPWSTPKANKPARPE